MKKILSLLLAFSLALSLAACGGSASSAASSAAVSEVASSAAASEEEETAAPLSATEPLRIAGLKGPTTMGLVNLLSMEQAGTAAMDYDLQLYGAADEIVPLLIKGELDMAAIPANLAATLYQKTSGGIQAVAVNTLGVLYVVEQGDTVHSMADLKGRTILSTGKGTTPEYVLRYLLTANGLDPDKDVDIQYYSEATEVTAQMASTQDAIAVLPQPYVTAAGLKDDTLRVALDLTAEWDKVADTQLITGVTVVRKAYAEEHPDVVAAFLADYAQSVNAANTDLDGTAALCEEQGVVAKAAIAKKALPNCNIVCLTGEELKADVSGKWPEPESSLRAIMVEPSYDAALPTRMVVQAIGFPSIFYNPFCPRGRAASGQPAGTVRYLRNERHRFSGRKRDLVAGDHRRRGDSWQ